MVTRAYSRKNAGMPFSTVRYHLAWLCTAALSLAAVLLWSVSEQAHDVSVASASFETQALLPGGDETSCWDSVDCAAGYRWAHARRLTQARQCSQGGVSFQRGCRLQVQAFLARQSWAAASP